MVSTKRTNSLLHKVKINLFPLETTKKTNFLLAPLNNTVNDFWKMIWEQKVYVIGMSTTFFDETRNETQSIEYWGQSIGEIELYGNICVKKVRGETNFDFVTTTLELTNLKVVKTDTFLSFFSMCVIFRGKPDKNCDTLHDRKLAWHEFATITRCDFKFHQSDRK